MGMDVHMPMDIKMVLNKNIRYDAKTSANYVFKYLGKKGGRLSINGIGNIETVNRSNSTPKSQIRGMSRKRELFVLDLKWCILHKMDICHFT